MDQTVVSQPVNKYCQSLYQAGEVVVYRTGTCDPYSLEGMSHITQMLSSMTNAIKEKHSRGKRQQQHIRQIPPLPLFRCVRKLFPSDCLLLPLEFDSFPTLTSCIISLFEG